MSPELFGGQFLTKRGCVAVSGAGSASNTEAGNPCNLKTEGAVGVGCIKAP